MSQPGTDSVRRAACGLAGRRDLRATQTEKRVERSAVSFRGAAAIELNEIGDRRRRTARVHLTWRFERQTIGDAERRCAQTARVVRRAAARGLNEACEKSWHRAVGAARVAAPSGAAAARCRHRSSTTARAAATGRCACATARATATTATAAACSSRVVGVIDRSIRVEAAARGVVGSRATPENERCARDDYTPIDSSKPPRAHRRSVARNLGATGRAGL